MARKRSAKFLYCECNGWLVVSSEQAALHKKFLARIQGSGDGRPSTGKKEVTGQRSRSTFGGSHHERDTREVSCWGQMAVFVCDALLLDRKKCPWYSFRESLIDSFHFDLLNRFSFTGLIELFMLKKGLLMYSEAIELSWYCLWSL